MIVADTSVIAAAVLGEARSPHARVSRAALDRGDSLAVPDLIYPEFANVAWKYVRACLISREVAAEFLHAADALITHAVATARLWERALELAIEHDHPVYDMCFVTLAELQNTRLLTLDAKLRRRVPHLTAAPG